MDAYVRGRPADGAGHYLRDLVYGATDGVVTTLAVIAGVTGANLAGWVAVVLGIANLVADGLSMAVSNYLGLKSELEQEQRSIDDEQPWRHGFATFAAFVVVGAVPLAAFAIAPFQRAAFAIAFGLVALAGIGVLRSRYIQRAPWRCSLEVVLLAGSASAISYVIGAILQPLV
jgi:vacuolar iron transporter family protein